MFQLQSVLQLGRRPGFFQSTIKSDMLGGKIIEAHIARCGVFKGYRDGEFQLTRKIFDQIINNFESEENVLPVYFGHSDEHLLEDASEPEAKGWILGLIRRGDDLWAKLEMTDEMESKIKAGKFRFTSIRATPEAVHRETGEPIGHRMVSLAITNQPFIDGLEALALNNLPNGGKVATYSHKDIATMIDQSKVAEKILTALKLKADAGKLEIVAQLLKEIQAAEHEDDEEDEVKKEDEEKEEEVAAAEIPDEQAARLEELRVKCSDIVGEELDMEAFMDKIDGFLDELAGPAEEEEEAVEEQESLSAEQLAAKINARKVDGPAPVASVTASTHPGILALKAELDQTKQLLQVHVEEKNTREQEDNETAVMMAIDVGKIFEVNKDYWLKAMARDKEGTVELFNNMQAVHTGRIVTANKKDSERQSAKVIALSEHEQRILAGAMA